MQDKMILTLLWSSVLDLFTQSFRYYSDMPARHYRLLKIYSNSSVVHKIDIYVLTRNLSLLLEVS